MNDLTLVIPAKKEKESLPRVLGELNKYNYPILVVLEESDKETIEAIKNFDCKIIYQIKKGYGDALILGIKNIKTQLFCIFNADGSFNPNEIEGMIQQLIINNDDIIFGSRYQENATSEDDTWITILGNYLFSKIGKIFFNLPITDILYTFVLGKTSTVNKLNLKSNDFRFCVELPIKAIKNKLKISSIESHERSRIAGTKKVNALKDGFMILRGLVYLYIN